CGRPGVRRQTLPLFQYSYSTGPAPYPTFFRLDFQLSPPTECGCRVGRGLRLARLHFPSADAEHRRSSGASPVSASCLARNIEMRRHRALAPRQSRTGTGPQTGPPPLLQTRRPSQRDGTATRSFRATFNGLLPIPFQLLLKDLCGGPLVNFGKIVEGQRGDNGQDIRIDNL